MFIKNSIRANIANLSICVFIAYLLSAMIITYDIKATALVGFVVFVLIAITRKEYAFYFLLASRSIIDSFYSAEAAGGVRITHYLGALVGVLLIIFVLIEKRNVFRVSVNKYLMLFALLSTIPILFTSSKYNGFVDWFKMLQGFFIINLTIMVVLDTDTTICKKRMNIICWCMVLALLLPSVLFIKNYAQGVQVMMGGVARYSTFGSIVNAFSYYLLAIFPVCLFFYSNSTQRSRKLYWLVLMAILLLFVYETNTRNVWIGLATLIFVWNLVRRNYKVIYSFLGVFVVLLIFEPSIRDRFKDIYEIINAKSFYDLDPRLLSQRIGVWQSNLQWFFHKSNIIEKLFGNGYDVTLKIPNLNPWNDNPIMQHSNYLTLLMMTGIFGLVAYYLYIFKLFQVSFKVLRRTKDVYFKNLAQIFISVLSSYVIVCFFTHMIWKINFHYFFSALAGLIVAVEIFEETKASENIGEDAKVSVY